MHQIQRNQSHIMREKCVDPPQVGIYNRHFYLRGAQLSLKQSQYKMQVKQLANKPKISVSSYNILVQQLENKLIKTFMKHSGVVDQKNSKFNIDNILINYTQLQNIVCQMCSITVSSYGEEMDHFLSQLWLLLGKYKIQSQIKASLLYKALRIFLDPYQLNVREYLQMLNCLDQCQNADHYRQQFLKEYNDYQDQTLSLEQIIKLWKKIRISNPVFRKNPQRLSTMQQSLTFKPQINKRSQHLAKKSLKKYLSSHQSVLTRALDPQVPQYPQFPHEKINQNFNQNDLSRYLQDNFQTCIVEQGPYFNKPSYYDILYSRRLGKDNPKQKNREDSYYSNKQSRTAHPEQIKQIVNNLYVVKYRKQDTDFVKKEEEQELKLCTFSPKINKNFNNSRDSISPSMIKGYQKQVGRLNKGRQQKQKKKQAYDNLGRVKNFSRNYSKSPNRSIAPSFIDRDTPKLILQINIDGDRVQKLALKGNQNAHLVSKKFVIKHGLEQHMIQVLQALVEQQLKNL